MYFAEAPALLLGTTCVSMFHVLSFQCLCYSGSVVLKVAPRSASVASGKGLEIEILGSTLDLLNLKLVADLGACVTENLSIDPNVHQSLRTFALKMLSI